MTYDKTPKQHLNEILGPRDTMSETSLLYQVLRPSTADQVPRADDRQVGGTHYRDLDVSPWDVVDTWPLEQRIGAYRAGALKYLMRMGAKDEATQEIAKGIHYLEKLLDTLKQREKS